MLELPDLSQITRELLQQIPRGQVTTYQALAIALGDKIAARVIPQLIAPYESDQNPLTHKVVQSDGTVTGRTEDERTGKAQQLQAEGIPIQNGQSCFSQNISSEVFSAMRRSQNFKKLSLKPGNNSRSDPSETPTKL